MSGRFTRRDLLGASRVAAIATVLVAVAYAVVVVLLDVIVSGHLTGQVDRQLSARLQAAISSPRKAFASSGVQASGARYGLGIYGEPIALWQVSPGGHIERVTPGAPPLPAPVTSPPPHDEALDATIDGQPFRLEWLRTRGGWLLAGESLTELGHVEAVLALSEAIAFPFLLAAFFLVALAIGLRSARPVEIARRRQLEFTADASHELRTPLSVIEAEVSLARSRRREPAELVATLDRVAGESRRLRSIVEDLLWLARADAEPAPLGRELVDLGEVARSVATRLEVIARPRGQTIEVAAPPPDGVAAVVSAPPDWIDRLVGTLVHNACRYTPDGSRICLTVSRTATSISLCVEDDGPGIPADEREQVFNRFRRATVAPGGHGLGLAIARAVTEGTGGRLSVGTSELGGARFEASWASP